ncbi:MarR family transcriptional regulator (plasmid) [Peteryoungia desertarenae]|uniref:MarR family transcriptional regulator n=1 Tax=Peteryoungia desertarenae TaxID=1813451 RepID=A0ABX6QTK4_9HYPH|nr:MarR family transcriptional regulator [Peteryoungia desertarenae]QLF71916.1 MarR family transcriptional regulator [Peteryoungia desertarenae]
MTGELTLEQSGDESIDYGPLSNSLGFLLRIAQLRNFDQFYSRLGDSGLRPGEFSVMWLIYLNPGIRQGQLGRILSIKPAHMTKVVRRLEDLGRLERRIPEEDRRSVRLSLTDKGRHFVQAHEADFFGEDSYHNHGLTQKETETFIRLLRKYGGFTA